MKTAIGRLAVSMGLSVMATTSWAASKTAKAQVLPSATTATLHAREQARARLDDHLAMGKFVGELAKQSDVALLRELHGSGAIELHLQGKAKLSLDLGAATLHVDQARHPATFGELLRIGVATPDRLLDLLEQRLLKDAGHTEARPLHAERATALTLARGTAQQQIAAREKFHAVWGANGRHGAPNPDIVLLSDHAQATAHETATVVFPDKTVVHLSYWRPGDMPSLRSNKGDIDATSFMAMGFATPEAVQEVFNAHLLRTAGVSGAPTDARALRRAREILRAQMKEAAYMKPYLEEAATHRDVARLAAAKALFAAPGASPEPAVIVQNAKEMIGAVAGKKALQRVDRASGATRDATFADLLRFEIDSYDTYDTAIGVAMTKMIETELVAR